MRSWFPGDDLWGAGQGTTPGTLQLPAGSTVREKWAPCDVAAIYACGKRYDPNCRRQYVSSYIAERYNGLPSCSLREKEGNTMLMWNDGVVSDHTVRTIVPCGRWCELRWAANRADDRTIGMVTDSRRFALNLGGAIYDCRYGYV